jgi:peptide/nickel transport system ATP-binding protein
MVETALEIQGLEVTFPALGRNTQAVRGVDLALHKGEVLGLVGESGSGKSISSLACLGLVPTPGIVSGSVKVSGQEIIGQSEPVLTKLRGGSIAMIFQNPMASLNPFFTIGNQLLGPIQNHRSMNKDEAKREALSSLEKVRLPDPDLVLGKYPHQLSGGQLQRVMIALALACKPTVLIADEPTTALDVTVQAQILLLLRDLLKTEDMSVLFITHDLGVVATLCDRVAVMYAGKIVETADADTIFSRPSHPYTHQLLATVPRLGRQRDSLPAIEGQVPDMSAPPAGCAFHPRCRDSSEVCHTTTPDFVKSQQGGFVACHHPVFLDNATREAG